MEIVILGRPLCQKQGYGDLGLHLELVLGSWVQRNGTIRQRHAPAMLTHSPCDLLKQNFSPRANIWT
jgi:hypothetical protein